MSEYHEQIIYALKRQHSLLDQWAKDLAKNNDYNCMFYEEDAKLMLEAIEIVKEQENKDG